LKRSHWILVAALAVVTVGIFWMWRARAGHEAPRFRTAEVESGSISSTVSATGTVQPVDQVEVGSQVSGTVYRLNADYNSHVTDGQVLCELEPSGFRARAAMNEAAVARADAALEDARRQLRRARELAAQNLVSQAELEAAEVALQQRQADLKAARAQLDAAQVDLRNTVIRAPISGVVISRNIDLGQTVAASLQAPKLFVIARDLAQMQVETRIDEADIGVVKPDLPVTFSVDAFPDYTFRGVVSVVRLEPIVDQGVVTYTTVIATGNPGLRLRPGMTANVTVLVARHDDVLKIPAAALRFRPPDQGRRNHGGEGRGAMAEGGGATGRPAEAGPAQHGAQGAPGGEVAQRGAPGAPGGASPDRAGMRGGRGPGEGGPGGMPPGMGERSGRPTPEMIARYRAMRGGDGAAGMRGGHGTGEGGPGAPREGAPAMAGSSASAGGDEPPAAKPGVVYVLRGGKPVRVQVTTGLSDGTSVEVLGGELRPGDVVVIGLEIAATGNQGLAPPPGMGGRIGGPGMGGRR